MTVDVRVDLSRNGEGAADRAHPQAGPAAATAGVKLDSTAILKRYCGNLPNWYNDLLREVDSLLLTRDQVEAITHRAGGLLGAHHRALAKCPPISRPYRTTSTPPTFSNGRTS
jgi:hypothetical protein